ncbi:hypothetical protein EDI_336470 [Entamoeba dispar SAW760]|uniref:dolichol kinase n=1 Tax=Entamoeba dispar (strain ATCC PRA-260 / SAW760) TaxID=370354 RepID=B0ERV3_ENTDS|nr:uncharacterized protein EDI_336470 [Entamoeba dispar SAW760]EDR22748.1 hypothetical protein EDI_336470 [Entamoeba dispar SAW760]|eukprot:EDR22748.1 hypothetical protein EDI_336470 [Entamoeba dispar SAW760]
MKIKQLTTLKIIVVIFLSCYTLIYRKQYVIQNYISLLYLLGYIIDLILSILAHYAIKSKFFQQFKCYNDDTTVIEFHCLLMNVSLSFLATKSHSAIYIHIICLLLVFLLSIAILCNIQFMRFRVPFTYCEFGTHISLILLLIFVQQPQFILAPSTIQSFIKNYPPIIMMWIFLLVLMVVIAFLPHQPMYVSVQRKSFHFIAALIYTLGIRSNALFLSVLSNNLVILFVILDFLRIQFAPNGTLSQLFQRYRDSHQDPNLSSGFPAFLLLYVNTLPLLLFRSHFHCAIISTIITVDIGDAFAAINSELPIQMSINALSVDPFAGIEDLKESTNPTVSKKQPKLLSQKEQYKRLSIVDSSYEQELLQRPRESEKELGSWVGCSVDPLMIPPEDDLTIEKLIAEFL